MDAEDMRTVHRAAANPPRCRQALLPAQCFVTRPHTGRKGVGPATLGTKYSRDKRHAETEDTLLRAGCNS